MDIQMMEGLVGASTSLKMSGTPMGVYRQASGEGDTEKMKQALGYTSECTENAVKYQEKIDKVQKSEEGSQSRPLKPVMDEYVPEEPQEPSGRYWIGKDEDGQPKIYFDDPERASDVSEERDELPGAENPKDELPDTDSPDKGMEADGPERKAAHGKKAEICRGSTDAVDREIEKLKQKWEELERQINSETDDTKVKE